MVMVEILLILIRFRSMIQRWLTWLVGANGVANDRVNDVANDEINDRVNDEINDVANDEAN